ncbi:MAG TPA: hypothetical protein PKC47_06995 [Petrimonas sp.]|nr:hypothetical protein [Petrimonas sp.]
MDKSALNDVSILVGENEFKKLNERLNYYVRWRLFALPYHSQRPVSRVGQLQLQLPFLPLVKLIQPDHPFGYQQEFTFAKTVKINWLKVNVNFNSFI